MVKNSAKKDKNSLEKLTKRIVTLRDMRDWKQFHNPKDLAISLVLESNEVMEHFQWKNKDEMDQHLKDHKEDIGDELADTLYWILLMGNDFGIDILKALDNKLKKIEEKYPVEKSKGNHTKYTKLKPFLSIKKILIKLKILNLVKIGLLFTFLKIRRKFILVKLLMCILEVSNTMIIQKEQN
jgi:NTP pyrophosphatase (non-canonical NTP hydrolase)